MEVIWKVVAVILNLRLTASITFHDFLHRFWAGCGTGTTNLEAKLLLQLLVLKEEVLYSIFLDLKRRMTPWTHPGDLRSCNATVWSP